MCLEFSCKRAQSRTIALSQMSKIEFTRILPWRAIALLRTCSGYAERSRIFVQASAIEPCSYCRAQPKISKEKSQRRGTTPQDRHFIHRHRRTAFQAEPFQLPTPRTSSPVTVASLRTAFQAGLSNSPNRYLSAKIRNLCNKRLFFLVCL